MAAQAKDGLRGFLSKQIPVRSLLEHRGDVHHIFPRDYLKKLGMRRAEYNQVANYVYTQQEINIAIGNRNPSEYMTDVLGQCDSKISVYGGIIDKEDLRRNMIENAIPNGFLNGDLYEYEDFLQARRKKIAETLKAYYFSL